MKEDKLVHSIDGKDYLMFEKLVTAKTDVLEFENEVKRCKGIHVGYGEVKKAGMFTSGYVITKILIPFDKIKQWQRFQDDD